jgi:hypothetical protein
VRALRGQLATAVGAAVLLTALVVAGRWSSSGLQHPGSPTSVATSLAWVPPPSTAPSPITAHIRFEGEQITAVVAGEGAVWVAHGCAISRVDPQTNRVVATVTGIRSHVKGCFGLDLGVGAGALWAVASGGELLRVDPHTMRVVAALALASVAPPAATASGVWLACCWRGISTAHPAGWLVRVDPRVMRVVARVRLAGLPDAVGVGPGGVWVTGAGGPIWRVDPASGRVVATIRVPGGLGGLPGREGPANQAGDVLVGSDAVWVSNPANAEVLRIDPRRDRLQGRAFTGGPALVTADGAVWATSSTTLVPLDDQARREVPLGELGAQGQPDQFLDEQGQLAEISDLAAGSGAVWVAAPAGLFRVDLARLR